MTNQEVYIIERQLKLQFKQERLKRKFYIETISDLSGLSANTIGRIERSECGGNLKTLIKYADALGMEIKLVPKEKSKFYVSE